MLSGLEGVWGRGGGPSTVVWSLRPWTCQKVAEEAASWQSVTSELPEVARQPVFSLAESLPEKQSLFLLVPTIFVGHPRAPPSGFPTPLN